MATARTERCPACGGDAHVDAPCAPRPVPEIEMLLGGPCRCLPDPEGGDWLACAFCGLRQRPGKDFCGYCGSRWVTAGEH
jgi:RNA polymerase subunit RPABC4/transcription elongation factor Spt4